jgi:hypothetical protein
MMKRGSMKVVPIIKNSLLLLLLLFIPFVTAQEAPCCYTQTTPPFETGTMGLSQIAFGPNGCLAVGSGDGTVNIFAPTNADSCVYTTSPASIVNATDGVSSVAFSPDGCLAFGDNSGVVSIASALDISECVYNPSTSILNSPFKGSGPANAVAFGPNSCLAIGYDSGGVAIFTPTDTIKCVYGLPLSLISDFTHGPVHSVAFSPNECLAVGYNDGTVNIFKPNHPGIDCSYVTVTSSITNPGVPVLSVTFSEDECLVVSYSNGTISVFAPIPPLSATTCTYNSKAATPIPSFGTAGSANSVTVAPQRAAPPPFPMKARSALRALDPVNECIAAAYNDGTVRIFAPINPSACMYNTSPASTIMPPSGSGAAKSVAFAPNGCLGIGYANNIVSIFAPTELEVSITGNTSVCQGGTTTLTANPEGGTSSFTFLWTGPNGFTSTMQTIAVSTPGTYTVTVTDANGCMATASVTVTTIVPGTPTLISAVANCNGTITVTGTAEPNSIIIVLVNGGAIGTGTSDASGHFSFSTNGSIPNGTFTVMVQSINSAGCISGPSNAIEVTVNQAIRPVICVTVNCPNVTVTGVASPNATVTIFVDNVPVANVTADSQGNFTFTTTLAKGTHTINADSITTSGCVSGISNTVTVNVTNQQAQRPAICATVKHHHVLINGTAEPHSKVTIFVDGKKVGEVRADSHGNFTFKVKLHKGHHEITARSKDKFGCKSKLSNKVEVEVEKEHEHHDKHEKERRPAVCATVICPNVIINGSAEEDSKVTIFANGREVGTTTANDEGNFTFTTRLIDGTYRITVQSKDRFGCRSKVSNTATVVVNCQAKLSVTLTSPDVPVTFNHRPTLVGTITSTNTAVITRAIVGAAPLEKEVTIFGDGTFLGTTKSDSNGRFTFVPRNPLSSGTHTFIAEIVDNGTVIVSNQVHITIQEQGCNQLVAALTAKLCLPANE